jgi:hypothetical protein
MSDISILTRRSFYHSESHSAKLSVYIQQQKIIKAIRKVELSQEDHEELLDKIIDCNDSSILKIYKELEEKGIEKTLITIKKLRMSKIK